MSDPLTKLSSKYGCDKSDRKHKYTPKYNKYFKKDRNREFNMLEFGFGKGNSVKMWMEYFTKANLVTVDIMEKLPNDKLINKYIKSGRFEFVSADQIDMGKIIKIFNKHSQFYLIIDDASHVAEDQQYTFYRLFEYVEPGGYYVIEDLKCKRSHSTRFEHQSDKTLKVLNDYVKTGIFDSKILIESEKIYISELIESVEIYNNVAFIKKR